MPSPIAIQLYSVREALAKDFVGVVTHLAKTGYVGVEAAGFPGTTAQEAAPLFRDLGLSVPAMHSPMLAADKQGEILEAAAALGVEYIVVPWLPPEEYKTVDSIKAVCDKLNAASRIAREHGFKLSYHNHWFEFAQVGGQLGHEILRSCLDPSISFELDTYWIKTAGPDPVQVIKTLGSHAPLLHIKDGPAVPDQPQVAVGDGSLDIPAIVHAGEGHTRWLVVELDSCATDMMTAVDKSYRYLVSKGLARGNKS